MQPLGYKHEAASCESMMTRADAVLRQLEEESLFLTPSFGVRRFNLRDEGQLAQAKKDIYKRYQIISIPVMRAANPNGLRKPPHLSKPIA